jgi:hypothetical protein
LRKSTLTFEARNLDRTQLYQSWDKVARYVVEGFRSETIKESKSVARYVNLIANALNVIGDGQYLPPTRRPSWDQSIKPDRLARNNNIPGFEPEDYKKIVTLLCSADEDTKRAAERLLRLYPSDKFYQHIEALPKQSDFEKCNLAFVSEAAVYYFYNRIVEFDGTFALDKASRDWIGGNYNDGIDWVKRAAVKDPSFGVFSSMLDYAYGLVLWDHSDKAIASTYFNRMLDGVRLSNASYPSNPRHIAIALKLVNEPDRKSKTAESTSPYNTSELHAISQNYVATSSVVNLFALPEVASKHVGSVKTGATERIYLRADSWDLIQAERHVGWAHRTVTNAGG